jgi:signal transduction histidine kinase/CheY-like chemotaxis protein
MHGYTVEEMLSMGLARLDVEGTAPVPDRISRILRGETLSFEVEHYHRDGHIFPLSVTANLVSMSHEQMIIAIHHDLTERKRAEEEKRRCLEEAERLAAEAAVIAEIGRVIGETLDIEEVFMRLATETQKLILFDRLAVNLHRLQEENVKVAYVFGEKIPGRHVGDIFPMKGSTCEVLTRTRSGLLNFPQSDGGMNGHFRHHDAPVQMRMCSVLRVPLIYRDEVIGSLFWGSKTPDAYTERDLRLAEKIGAQVAGAIGSAKLYSERKQAEEERARLQEQLVQSQKMESVGRLAGGVAHDFNNILGVIIGHADMALEQISPSESIYADLNEILKAANRSADLTRQLLAFARKQVISPRVLDLNDTVAGMLKMLQRLIGEDIHLAWLPGVNLWPVKIDPSQIDQILANLSVNARDAIAGVGKVAIETGNVTLAKASCTDYPDFIPGEYVLLAVSDNGCGMDKEIKSKLFEPFFTTKKTGKGTGLGLAMVYGIVKQNGGFIDVCSEPNQGTTLKIYLPRHEEKTEQPQADEPPEVVMRGWETVMIVEDEKALLDLSKRILEKQGYRVLATGTPDEAIRLALQHTGELHLLMTDVVMPEMNGRDLAQKLLSVNPNLKCLFTSGYTADVIAQHGVLDENVHFIQKPFSRKDLAAKVRAVLDQK